MRSNISPLVQLSAPSRPIPRRRRRRRRQARARIRRTPTGVLIALALASVLTGASVLVDDVEVTRGDVVAGPVAGTGGPPGPATGGGDGPAATAAPAGDGPPARFARHEGVTLRLPVAGPLGVRFTQGRRVGAVPLEPMGTLTANANPQGFDASLVVERAEGPEFAVAAPAGRGRPPTSAALISVPGGAWVRSPLAGEVAEVEQYGRADGADWRVVVSAEIRPELRVTISGLHQPAVDVGDAVAAGQTLGAPRLIRDGVAEVRIEMRPAGAPITVEGDDAE